MGEWKLEELTLGDRTPGTHLGVRGMEAGTSIGRIVEELVALYSGAVGIEELFGIGYLDAIEDVLGGGRELDGFVDLLLSKHLGIALKPDEVFRVKLPSEFVGVIARLCRYTDYVLKRDGGIVDWRVRVGGVEADFITPRTCWELKCGHANGTASRGKVQILRFKAEAVNAGLSVPNRVGVILPRSQRVWTCDL